MKLVIFALAVSSSWGNGHATLWRGLIAALTRRGHKVVFFERDVPYYANTRDLTELPGNAERILYPDWRDVTARALDHLKGALAVTRAPMAQIAYCPSGHLFEAAACGVPVGRAARAHTLASHTADHRAEQLETILEDARNNHSTAQEGIACGA